MTIRNDFGKLLINGKESPIKPTAVQVLIDGIEFKNWIFADDTTNQAHLTQEQQIGGGKTRVHATPDGRPYSTVRPGRITIVLPSTY